MAFLLDDVKVRCDLYVMAQLNTPKVIVFLQRAKMGSFGNKVVSQWIS